MQKVVWRSENIHPPVPSYLNALLAEDFLSPHTKSVHQYVEQVSESVILRHVVSARCKSTSYPLTQRNLSDYDA